MKSLISVYLVFFSSNLLAQEIVVNGSVLDSQTLTPIPFVHIYINPSVGTVTNTEGEFLLKYNLDLEGLVTLSCLGYNTLYLNIDSLNKGTKTRNKLLNILLEPATNILDEVIITSKNKMDSAYFIMELVLKNIHKNYSTKKYGLKAFYREANISDTTYSRLIEAQLYISSKGYDSPIEKDEIEILQLRKTADNRDLGWRQSLFDWLYSINGGFKTLANDRVRLSSKPYNDTNIHENFEGWLNYERNGYEGAVRFLSKEFINGCNLNIYNVLKTDNDTTYVIEYIARKQITKRQGKGFIYVNKSDWAIKEIHSEVVKPDTTKYYQLDYTLKNSRAYYQTIIKYQKHRGKYYLSYIKSNSIGTNSRGLIGGRDHTLFYKSKGKAGTIYQENELYITSIIPYRKIKKKNRLDKEEDIYDADIKNDTIFWAQYNFPLLNPLTDKMRNDLKTVNNEIFIK